MEETKEIDSGDALTSGQRRMNNETPELQSTVTGEEADLGLAKKLQEEEKAQYERDCLQSQQMLTSLTGRALKFVERVQGLHATLAASSKQAQAMSKEAVQLIGIDHMLCTAEMLFDSHTRTVLAGKEPTVDVGFHYTAGPNLEQIRTDGLLSRPEREEKHIDSKFNGAAYGEGIYTADSYMTHRRGRFGDTCILVVRLYGLPLVCSSRTEYLDRKEKDAHDSVRVGDTLVLLKSYQCLPIVKFPSNVIFPEGYHMPGNQLLQEYQNAIQKLIEEFLDFDMVLFYESLRDGMREVCHD